MAWMKVRHRYRRKITVLTFANGLIYLREEKSNSRSNKCVDERCFSDVAQTRTRVDIPARRENTVLRVGISSRGTPEGLFCQPVMSSPLGTTCLFVLIVLFPSVSFFFPPSLCKSKLAIRLRFSFSPVGFYMAHAVWRCLSASI